MPSAFLAGLALGLGLIVAIGPQNAFVLRQGLWREHVAAVALTCALSDALLIAAGVLGLKSVIALAPWLRPLMRYAGAAFLLWYGARSLRAALTASASLAPDEGRERPGRGATVATCLALTWLNPHVYLDTLFLIGSVATRFPGSEKAFALGAMTASFLFFFSLAYGAALLRPVFANPAAWRALDAIIALVMGWIAVGLLTEGGS